MILDPSDVEAALAELQGWTDAGDTLTKTYSFDDFAADMDFMQRAAGPIRRGQPSSGVDRRAIPPGQRREAA